MFILPQNLVLCFLCFPLCIVLFHLSGFSTITLAPAPVTGRTHSTAAPQESLQISLRSSESACLPCYPQWGERILKAIIIFIRIHFEDECIWDPKMMLDPVTCKSDLKIPTAKGFRSHLGSFHGLSKHVESKLIDKERGKTLLFSSRFWFTESLISLPITECRSHLHLTTLPVITVVQPMHSMWIVF